MNETKAFFENATAPKELFMIVELPDGTKAEKTFFEWWNHRREWFIADFEKQTDTAIKVMYRIMAALADEAWIKASQTTNKKKAAVLAREHRAITIAYYGDKE